MAALVMITVYYSIRVILHYKFSSGHEKFHILTKNWAKHALRIGGVKLDISGDDYFDKDKTYVFASNHSSFFDIPILIYGIKNNVRIIYKKELEKAPFFGKGLNRSAYISIDRSDPRKSMESLADAVKSIEEGDSVLIYPEGTRSPDGKLHEFKRGAFMLASRSGKPIVPVTIVGAYDIYRKGSFSINPGTVKIIFSPPLDNDSTDKSEEKKLMDKLFTIISENLSANS